MTFLKIYRELHLLRFAAQIYFQSAIYDVRISCDLHLCHLTDSLNCILD